MHGDEFWIVEITWVISSLSNMLALALAKVSRHCPSSITNGCNRITEHFRSPLLPLPMSLRSFSHSISPCLPPTRIQPFPRRLTTETWMKSLGIQFLSNGAMASRTKWGRLVREKFIEPSRRSWTQVVNRPGSFFQGNRFYTLGGFGGNDPRTVVWGLIGANLVVFGMWQFVDRRFMADNFMVSVNSLMSGRIHTVVTSAFSQMSFNHLAPNMLGLYFFGTEIAQIFGGRWLLNLYLAGAIAGSLGHVAYSAFVVPWIEGIPQNRFNARYTASALGASGAVNAIVLLQILLFPTRTIMVNFFIPVPAALFGIYLIGSDIYQAQNEGSRTAHAGHLGGALVGAIAWLRVRRRWR